MKKIRMSICFLMFFFVSGGLCAMEADIDPNEINALTVPLLQRKVLHNATSDNQVLDSEERRGKTHSYCAPKFSSYLKKSFLWLKGISCKLKDFLKNNISLVDNINLYSFPDEIILHIAYFLDSPDILRFSGSCRRFHTIFDEKYWLKHLSKIAPSYSCLMLNGLLSPSIHRKAFFSHLWYSERRLRLAVRLNHPEALMLQKYSKYGAYIEKDQYLCSSEVIKYMSGESDKYATEKLKEAKSRKIREDLEREGFFKIKNTVITKFYPYERRSWNN